MRPNFRLTAAQHPRPLALQLRARREDVVHLVADVMNAARRIFIQEILDWRALTERKQQLNLCIWQLDENNRHTVIWFILWRANFCTQSCFILRRSRLQIRHCNCHVIEPSNHFHLLFFGLVKPHAQIRQAALTKR